MKGIGVLRRILALLGLSGRPEQKEVPPHIKIALPLVISGIAIMSPGIKDILMSLLNTRLGLGLSLDTPWYAGGVLAIAGIGVYLYGEHGVRRAREIAAAIPPGTFVALHHQSFEPPTGRLPDSGIPGRLGRRTIRHVECDQSPFFSGTRPDPGGAVRQQDRVERFDAILAALPLDAPGAKLRLHARGTTRAISEALARRPQHHCIPIRIDGPSLRSPDLPAPPPAGPSAAPARPDTGRPATPAQVAGEPMLDAD
jgi:hypothetical protein